MNLYYYEVEDESGVILRRLISNGTAKGTYLDMTAEQMFDEVLHAVKKYVRPRAADRFWYTVYEITIATRAASDVVIQGQNMKQDGPRNEFRLSDFI